MAELNDDLEELERPRQMRRFGLILENVDGFDPDPTTHFVLRSVPHTLSLATSITRPPGSPNPPADRTGWPGDGAPRAGALRDFMTGAIRQHYTLRLERVPGRENASRLLIAARATDVEADRISALLSARRLLSQGSSAIGTNLAYRIDEGSVMF